MTPDPIAECVRCGVRVPFARAVADAWNASVGYDDDTDEARISLVCDGCQSPEEHAEGVVAAQFPDEVDSAILGAVEDLANGRRAGR